jgi:xanthine dehydrogenase YagT iron-sulfur-binding subunit
MVTATTPLIACTLEPEGARARKLLAKNPRDPVNLSFEINGRRVLGCLALAATLESRVVTTIEGLAWPDESLHPMQQIFIDNDAFQCGYCTPGQIMSAVACVREGHAESDTDIREYVSGNLCCCAAYPNIVAAINKAKGSMKET